MTFLTVAIVGVSLVGLMIWRSHLKELNGIRMRKSHEPVTVVGQLQKAREKTIFTGRDFHNATGGVVKKVDTTVPTEVRMTNKEQARLHLAILEESNNNIANSVT